VGRPAFPNAREEMGQSPKGLFLQGERVLVFLMRRPVVVWFATASTTAHISIVSATTFSATRMVKKLNRPTGHHAASRW
jgi:hypothetical protein